MKRESGFTLIEMVIGIIALMVSFSLVVTVLSPQASRSVDPMLQVRAAELGQALIEEIYGKAFDEQSTRVFGVARCSEVGLGAQNCTVIPQSCASGITSATEESARALFDDVDDYHCLSQSGSTIQTSLGVGLPIYEGFSITVQVQYDSDMNGVTSSIPETTGSIAKLITVSVTTPVQDTLVFSTYKFNY